MDIVENRSTQVEDAEVGETLQDKDKEDGKLGEETKQEKAAVDGTARARVCL
jgi:hypothetical protein